MRWLDNNIERYDDAIRILLKAIDYARGDSLTVEPGYAYLTKNLNMPSRNSIKPSRLDKESDGDHRDALPENINNMK